MPSPALHFGNEKVVCTSRPYYGCSGANAVGIGCDIHDCVEKGRVRANYSFGLVTALLTDLIPFVRYCRVIQMPSFDFRVKRDVTVASGCRRSHFARSLKSRWQTPTAIGHTWTGKDLISRNVVAAGLWLVPTAGLAESLRLLTLRRPANTEGAAADAWQTKGSCQPGTVRGRVGVD